MDTATMQKNGEHPHSIAYWQTRLLDWNGEPVVVSEPARSYPMRPNELSGDGS